MSLRAFAGEAIHIRQPLTTGLLRRLRTPRNDSGYCISESTAKTESLYMNQLNPSQLKAVKYSDGPLLIVAGAGTGKTTVITKKIAHLIESGLAKPEEILAVTFTDKAAGEMIERVDQELDAGYADLQISTFHAFCQRLLEHHGLDIGISNQFKLLTQTDAWLLVRQNLEKFNLDYYRPLGNPTRHIHELIKHFSKCKDELVSPEEYLQHAKEQQLNKDFTEEAGRLSEIANVYHVYNQLLLDNNTVDFGDLIYYAVKLLEKRPNILKSLQERFKYILVDEFQDVNWAQYYFIKLIAQNGRLTVVGDDDQSIYAFRGASVSNILRFKQDFPKAKEVVLTENYRSGQEILDLAYKSIQNNNPDRLEAKLKIDKSLKSLKSLKSKVEHLHFDTVLNEAEGVAKRISVIRDLPGFAGLDGIAILVRANSHAEPFITALERAGISYEFLASSGLFRQPIVLDAYNFLKAVDSYHESSAVFRLLKLPFFNFSENDLQKLTHFAKKKSISYYEALKRGQEIGLSKEGIEVCDKLVSLIHAGMQQSRIAKPAVILVDFFETSGYFKYLTHEDGVGNQNVIRQIHQLRQFFEEVKKYEETIKDANVKSFVEHCQYLMDAGEEGSMRQLEDTPDSVNILTIHRAKGLEFKYVFVVNLVEDRFPSRSRGEAIELPMELIKEQLPEGDFNIQEERRLFYVAMTRAKEGLFLTSASDYGGVRTKKISRFLAELGFAIEQNNGRDKISPTSYVIRPESRQKPNKQTAVSYVMPSSLSYSKINSYQRCPYQYKLAYILEIPTKGSASFSFGLTMHGTMQKFYQRVMELNSKKQDSLFGLPKESAVKNNGGIKVPAFQELLEIYEKTWIDDWYKNKKQREEYFAKGKKVLKVFYETQEDNWTIPAALEGWFKIKVGDCFINGRIDRIDKLSDGSLEIIDYKTGKTKEKVTGDEKNQLLIYQIAAQSLPEYKNLGAVAKLTYFYLEDNVRTEFFGKDEELKELCEKISATIDRIKTQDFTATPGPHVCGFCDFKDICEYRRL